MQVKLITTAGSGHKCSLLAKAKHSAVYVVRTITLYYPFLCKNALGKVDVEAT